jgi:hypothetical protein
MNLQRFTVAIGPIHWLDRVAVEQPDVRTEDELGREVEAPAAGLDSFEPASAPTRVLSRDGALVEDGFLGDRFWGQVQGFSGRLKALRGRGATHRRTSRVAGKAMLRRGSTVRVRQRASSFRLLRSVLM